MGTFSTLLAGLLLLSLSVSGQTPGVLNSYLKNRQISQAAKDYYKGKFKADDGKRTLSILDSLDTRNNETRPFYLYLVSGMMEKSDGALSEALGTAGKEFLERSPNNLMDFLQSGNKKVSTQFKMNWAKAIAGEFMISCEYKERECIKRSLKQVLSKTKAVNRLKVSQFYRLIESFVR